ncbi:glycosyltransferase family 4 protein [Gracilibacillus salinarum]|uniref:Glycosyltransferase family 4 protein n=1 Tax=Gracilibacillus salinarum TaxID=2932255 RepID=A0ABY4GRJ0_9BACI|nr:glycosyltransferase family 4 protein [Gracilibacillus salinarum]UOQ87013.1 glycosyltransferase family 4 protein [Gracilibacillus salinarum]
MDNCTKLVILTKYFGNNFTGANIATHEIVKRIERDFGEVVVFTKHEGSYDMEDISINKYTNLFELIKSLSFFKKNHNNFICYSDDHFGFIFKLLNIPYFHTYHGNWPDAKRINLTHYLKSFYYRPLYNLTLRNAKKVVNVSYYMDAFVRKLNSNTVVIRNGLGLSSEKKNVKTKEIAAGGKLNIVMIGNIDKRKYSLATRLFKCFENKFKGKVTVDIYGTAQDNSLVDEIYQYNFVKIKGFDPNIDFQEYDLLISTSKSENLSIAMCEALASGLPVITFNIGGLNEIVKNGENGFTIPRYDIKSMFDQINLIQEKGYDFVFSEIELSQYDWDKAANQYLKNFKM